VLIEGGYVITTARAVRPFDEVRVVFPDGTEFPKAPVLGVDQMADLAVIGPLDTQNSPLQLVDGDNLAVGSDVFLIGYPYDPELFPQPTLGSGSLTELSNWDSVGMIYYHTNVESRGSQSVGVVVSTEGEVIGISGSLSIGTSTNVSASASDVLERVDRLIAGDDVASLGDRRIPKLEGITEAMIPLDGSWHSTSYVIREPIGTSVEIEIDGENDIAFHIYDASGQLAVSVDEGVTGTEVGSFVTEIEAPYFLLIAQNTQSSGEFQIVSNRNLIPYPDIDDQTEISIGETYAGNIDFPGDLDIFTIDMTEGDVVEVIIESLSFDPNVIVTSADFDDEYFSDDNSGEGVLGFNSRLYYLATHTGSFIIGVTNAVPGGFTFGGYLLKVAEAPPEVVRSLQPTPTPPRFVIYVGSRNRSVSFEICRLATSCEMRSNSL